MKLPKSLALLCLLLCGTSAPAADAPSYDVVVYGA